MGETKKSKSVWGIVLKVIITVATAIAGGLRFQFLQVAYAYRYTVCCSLLGHASGREPGL